MLIFPVSFLGLKILIFFAIRWNPGRRSWKRFLVIRPVIRIRWKILLNILPVTRQSNVLRILFPLMTVLITLLLLLLIILPIIFLSVLFTLRWLSRPKKLINFLSLWQSGVLIHNLSMSVIRLKIHLKSLLLLLIILWGLKFLIRVQMMAVKLRW